MTRTSKGDAARLELSAFGRDFRLQLSNNTRLARLATGSSVQLYKGTLEGVPGSWARISIHDGLPRGMIWDGRELFIVDAAPESVNYGTAGTVMFKLSDAVLEKGVSFTGDTVETPREPAEAYGAMIGELRASTQALQAGVATQGVEISVLGDAAYLARYATETQAAMRFSFASTMSTDLQRADRSGTAGGIGESRRCTHVGSLRDHQLEPLLEELARLRQQNPALNSTGLTHLLTGRQLDGDTAGVAYTTALCSRRYAASLTMAHSSVALDTLIIAHEIGHVFGAPHDGAQQCAATPQNEHIMTPTITTSVSAFSQCSLDEINEVIASYSCVAALPSPAPVQPAPPAPPSGDAGGGGGGSGGGGGRGGGGSLDPSLLLLLLALRAGRPRQRSGSTTRR